MNRFSILDFEFSIGISQRRRIFGLALSAFLFLLCESAEAQQPTNIPLIAYLAGTSRSAAQGNIDAFRQGLRGLGYIERKDIVIEYRYAEGNLIKANSLVAELVHLNPNVLITTFSGGTRAAKEATKTIPIVGIFAVDPVETGVIGSLARPGGNITGVATLQRGLSGKRLELLREVVPRMSRAGIIWDADAPGSAIAFKQYELAAQTLKIQLQSLEVRRPETDIESAFQATRNGRVSAIITVRNPVLRRYRNRIVDFAIKNRLPSMYEGDEYVAAGGLMSYSADTFDQYRRAAYYVDKILKGAKPADLPVEQPTKFEFVINLKTAKQIGLIVPPSVLARADRVIR